MLLWDPPGQFGFNERSQRMCMDSVRVLNPTRVYEYTMERCREEFIKYDVFWVFYPHYPDISDFFFLILEGTYTTVISTTFPLFIFDDLKILSKFLCLKYTLMVANANISEYHQKGISIKYRLG